MKPLESNIYGVLASLLLIVTLSACNGETTTSSLTSVTPPPGSFKETYTTSISAGEILLIGIDTTTMTYTFKVLLSSHGLGGNTGKGNITSQNTDGSYNLAASPDGLMFGGKIYAVQKGEISGYVTASFSSGITFNFPVVGTSKPLLTVPEMSGTYNYVSYSCPTAASGNLIGTNGCTTDYGTISINNSFNFNRCSQQDLTTTPVCSSSTTGTLQSANPNPATVSTAVPGVFNFTRNGATSSGWVFAYTAANGKRIAVAELNEAAALNSFGYGQVVMAEQASVLTADIGGNYILYNFIEGNKPTQISGTTYTAGSTSTTTGSININSPWPGVISWSDSTSQYNGHAIIAGSGIYVSQMTPSTAGVFASLTNKWFELGFKH